MAFDFNKLTNASAESIQKSALLAREKNNSEISDLHLLFVLVKDQEGIAAETIKKQKADLGQLSDAIDEKIRKLAVLDKESENISISAKLAEVPDKADQEKDKLGDEFVSREHLLLALLLTECQSADILRLFRVLCRIGTKLLLIIGYKNLYNF